MNLRPKYFLLCLIAVLLVGCGTDQTDRSNKMSNHESVGKQAEAIVQLFEEANTVLSDYKGTRRPEDSDRFDKILDQIEKKWPMLVETYKKNRDPNVDDGKMLRAMDTRVVTSLLKFREYKENADKGIDPQIRAVHLITKPGQLVRTIRYELTNVFKDQPYNKGPQPEN